MRDNDMDYPATPRESVQRAGLLLDVRRTLLRRAAVLRSLRVALVVGTVLVAINHTETIMRGDFTPLWWAKVVLTYLVPFFVCNYGMLVAIRSAPTGGRD